MYEIRDGHTQHVHSTAGTLSDALRAVDERLALWRRQLAANGEGASRALLLTDVVELSDDGIDQTVLFSGDSFDAGADKLHLSLRGQMS